MPASDDLNPKRKPRHGEWLLTLPSLGWLAIFFIGPALIVFAAGVQTGGRHRWRGCGLDARQLPRAGGTAVSPDPLAHALDQRSDDR